ncbi:alpha/beta fold hydrolase [Granulicella arctica]|uniref:alpha/beta fold hydrolase n=1 Tax=Granulicella arctica TaxID=940613 RepID=UPI0021DFE877|nr:alpha/beta hydrolase [Granulicella arctica]
MPYAASTNILKHLELGLPNARLVSATPTNATAPTEYLEANGVRYAYRRFGEGDGPPLLFLQHFRGTMDDWDPWITDGLALGRTVILFDNVGIGRSSGEVPDSVAAMAHDALVFVDALGLKQIDLFAFSLGGFVGQQVLLDRPSLVRRAILAGTGPQGGHGMQGYTPDVTAVATKFPLEGREKGFLFFATSKTSQEAGAAFIDRTLLRREDRDIPTNMQAMQRQGDAIGAWGHGSLGAYKKQLETIKHPVLVVNGSEDIMVPSINAFELAQQLPDAQLIMYPDAGHGAIFQYAERFVAHATLFLQESNTTR